MIEQKIFEELDNIVDEDKNAIVEKDVAGEFNKKAVVRAIKKMGFRLHPTKKNPDHDLYLKVFPDGRKIEFNVPFHTTVKGGLLKKEVAKLNMTLQEFAKKL